MRITFNTKFTALCLWMGVIFLLSHQNGQDSSETSGILLELLKFIGDRSRQFRSGCTQLPGP